MTPTLHATFAAAEAELERGEFHAAFALYQQFLLDWLAASDPARAALESLTAREMVALERLADLAALFGQWQEASQVLGLLQDLFEQAGNRGAALYAALKLVGLEINRGQLWHARERWQQLAAQLSDPQELEFSEAGFARWEREGAWSGVARDDRAVLLTRFYLELGRLEAAQGEYQRAVAALKRGVQHAQPAAPTLAQQALKYLFLALAWASLEQGDLPSAEAALQSLPAWLNEAWEPGVAVQRLEVRGKLELLRGRLGAAKESLERALLLCEHGGFAQASAEARLNLAQVLIYLNQTAEAAAQLRQVQAMARGHDAASLQARAAALLRHATARSQSLIEGVALTPSITELWSANFAADAEAPEEAAAPAPDATEQNPFELSPSANYLARFEERVLGFHWLLSRPDLPAARQELDDISAVFAASDSLLIRTRLFVLDCLLDYYAGDFARAAQGFETVAPILQRLELLPELWQVQRFSSWCLAKMARPGEASRVRQAAEQTLGTLSASLPAAEQAIFLLNKWTAEEEYLAGELDQLMQMQTALAKTSRWRRPWRRWQLAGRLSALLDHVERYKGALAERELNERKAAARAEAKVKVAGWWRRLLNLARDRAVVTLLVLPDRVLVARAQRFGLDFSVSPLTRIQVRSAVREWHELILQGDDRSLRAAQDLLQTLAEHLHLDQVLTSLPARIRRLAFVPDDSLHGLPFSALRRQGRYLVEDFAVSVAFAWASTPVVAVAGKTALAVAVTRGVAEYPALAGAADELNIVQSWLAERGLTVTALSEQTATRDRVLAQLTQTDLFHIACHGTFQPNRPDCSGLVLAPGETVELLSLRDLARLQLPGLQQAVLSGCWSADSFILPGRWIISLPETFWRAGAHSVLGCLWEVDDRVAAPFMAEFYRGLATLPRDEALQQAQLACLQNRLAGQPAMNTADPVYWAGFTLYGQPDPLVVNTTRRAQRAQP